MTIAQSNGYKIWSVIKEWVYQNVQDVNDYDLRQQLMMCGLELHTELLTMPLTSAADVFHACIWARGGQSEYSLWYISQNAVNHNKINLNVLLNKTFVSNYR